MDAMGDVEVLTGSRIGRHHARRQRRNRLFEVGVYVLAALACAPLFFILGSLIYKGLGQLNISFFTESTPSTLEAMLASRRGDSIPGGIANGIVGTLLMVSLASVVAIPLGVAAGVYLSLYGKTHYAAVVRFVTDALQATPSIVVGIVMYQWVVRSMGSFSGFAGAMALAFMMLPLVARSTEESLSLLPSTLREAGLALGAPFYRVVFRILLPSAYGGISTGAILAIARTMGETAPLIMTALGSAAIVTNIFRPMSAVPLQIWEFYNDPNLMAMIWSSSLFLLLLTLLLNYLAHRMAR